MGETEAKVGRGIRSDLRHDWHTVSLLTDHLVFSPKYREIHNSLYQLFSDTGPLPK